MLCSWKLDEYWKSPPGDMIELDGAVLASKGAEGKTTIKFSGYATRDSGMHHRIYKSIHIHLVAPLYMSVTVMQYTPYQ